MPLLKEKLGPNAQKGNLIRLNQKNVYKTRFLNTSLHIGVPGGCKSPNPSHGCGKIHLVLLSISRVPKFNHWIMYVASTVLLCVFSSSVSSERVRIPNTYSLDLVLLLFSSHGLFFSLVAPKCDVCPPFLTDPIPSV